MISLWPDPSCRYNLTWSVQLSEVSPTKLIEAIKSDHSWTERTTIAVLTTIEHDDGHELLFVPATGRIQLRLSYLVSRGEREECARVIENSFVALLEQP